MAGLDPAIHATVLTACPDNPDWNDHDDQLT
jgi:hypothetical protein